MKKLMPLAAILLAVFIFAGCKPQPASNLSAVNNPQDQATVNTNTNQNTNIQPQNTNTNTNVSAVNQNANINTNLNKNVNTTKAEPAPTSNCGTSRALAESLDLSNLNVTGDKALTCMGNKILKNCEKGTMTLVAANTGSMTYSITGQQGGNCLIKTQYGDADQIPLEEQKVYANNWVQCPVSVAEITAQSKDPAVIALAAYFNPMPSYHCDSQKNCTETWPEGCTGTMIKK
ncbi:MAG: hypothetical protein WCW26_00510 [Candidatus Buchananbacteria bacterium]